MVEMNLKQIIDKLNMEFNGEGRKLVFWYDSNADFAEDIDSIELENAKVYKLEKDNQFRTKHFFERVDKVNNYLVYAPFPKPDVSENHLEDTLLYSKEFFADRASLLCVDLGISDKYKPVIEKHIKFFKGKDRLHRFYNLGIENFNEENIILGLLCAVCKTKVCSFEEVVRIIITDDLKENKYIADIEKYDLITDFWKLCDQQFGYNDPQPTIEKLVVTMFATYADRYIQGDMPVPWKNYVAYKAGNIIAFLDNFMNNLLYMDKYDELSEYAADILNIENTLKSCYPDRLVLCESFKYIDKLIIDWIIDRLVIEDTGANLGDYSITEICELRLKMHFGSLFSEDYRLLYSAFSIIAANNYSCTDGIANIFESYQNEEYIIDLKYRHFYYSYDRIYDKSKYENVRTLVENIYTNEYLSKQVPKWNEGLIQKNSFVEMNLQRRFYSKYIKDTKERTVVIISDAMRYEIGRELFNKLIDNPKATVNMEAMIGVLPSYTKLGMAALLPHDCIEITDDYDVLIDGKGCGTIAERQAILQLNEPKSRCVQFDDVKKINDVIKLREIFTGNSVVYMYHNQIDVRGEHAEDEVFNACSEAVQEIFDMISKISSRGNTYHFIVTADHGFIYKRDKVNESDKISGVSNKNHIVKRRYIISDAPAKGDGIYSMPLGYVLGKDDNRFVSFPCNTHVFKTTGGGLNYVHGGSSPQEMIIPVIEVKMDKYHVETTSAGIQIISNINKITNLTTSIDFIQSEPVSDIVKSTRYKLYFISEDNEKISNENIYIADKRDEESQKRIFRLKFTFKNKTYDKNKRYYIVSYEGEKEVFRYEVVMDILFADNYDF